MCCPRVHVFGGGEEKRNWNNTKSIWVLLLYSVQEGCGLIPQ